MSIQQNFNQGLSMASLLLSQTGYAKDVASARRLQSRQVGAVNTLRDIAGNAARVEKGEKVYSETELGDIEDRARSATRDIYDAKVAAAQGGVYGRIINPNYINQAEVSGLNRTIEDMPNMQSRAQAQRNASITSQDSLNARRAERSQSNIFLRSMKDYSGIKDYDEMA